MTLTTLKTSSSTKKPIMNLETTESMHSWNQKACHQLTLLMKWAIKDQAMKKVLFSTLTHVIKMMRVSTTQKSKMFSALDSNTRPTQLISDLESSQRELDLPASTSSTGLLDHKISLKKLMRKIPSIMKNHSAQLTILTPSWLRATAPTFQLP